MERYSGMSMKSIVGTPVLVAFISYQFKDSYAVVTYLLSIALIYFVSTDRETKRIFSASKFIAVWFVVSSLFSMTIPLLSMVAVDALVNKIILFEIVFSGVSIIYWFSVNNRISFSWSNTENK